MRFRSFPGILVAAGVGALGVLPAHAVGQDYGPPPWAYPVIAPDFKIPQDDRFATVDLHPEDHPKMPEIVSQGRKPDVFACGWCHRADGSGGPENARLAGLPASYIIQQMADFKSGARSTSLPIRGPNKLMTSLARHASSSDNEAAAAYFSALKPRAKIKVVETDVVPKTRVARWFLADTKDGTGEPIGQRIIEVPEDVDLFEKRDTRSGFIAYVPVGSVQKGKALATTPPPGKTIMCSVCHGQELKGQKDLPGPGIAGMSPSYVTRQLYDFQRGARAGAEATSMQPVVQTLTIEEIASLAAYVASLAP